MDILEKGAQRAIAILNQVGAQYRIVMPSGVVFGNLPDSPRPARGKRRFKDLYLEQVKAMQPGDILRFDPQDFRGLRAVEVKSLLTGALNQHIGCDNGAVCINDKTGMVEIMFYAQQ